MKKESRSIQDVLMRSPILWGALVAACFYGLVHADIIPRELVKRYFISHPTEYVATFLFSIGLAALVLKLVSVRAQSSAIGESPLGKLNEDAKSGELLDDALDRLHQIPAERQDDYYIRRLSDALEHVDRQGSADGLDEELKYLAERDAARAGAGYALVNVIIWAVPILGFLGTVIGITLALNNLNPAQLEKSLPQVMKGLFVAFDTTTLSLALSIMLMFAKFFVSQQESELLADVDHQVEIDLLPRFETSGTMKRDGSVAAIRMLAESVSASAEDLVKRQAVIWETSMEEAERRWTQMADSAGLQLRSAMGEALRESLQTHAVTLAEAAATTREQTAHEWKQVAEVQTTAGRSLAGIQDAMGQQAQVLQQAVVAMGELSHIEDALNRNLAALAGAGNFEQTVVSLAAAINLLNGRLAQLDTADSKRVNLDEQKTQAA